MLETRETSVAGSFYPLNPDQLKAEVEIFLEEGMARLSKNRIRPAGAPPPVALVAPHAGYPYSGSVAGTAFATLPLASPERKLGIERVVVIGPTHFIPFDGIAVPEAGTFETPLGAIRVDAAGVAELLRMPGVRRLEVAHDRDHAIEVELPFLLEALGPGFQLVPLLIGEMSPPAAAEVLAQAMRGTHSLLVVSTDLSHFLDHGAADEVDADTVEGILRLQGETLNGHRACGYRALQALIELARRWHLRPSLLDRRNSGDTAGDWDAVVGYAAMAFDAA